jgi:hypothetical protein
MSSCKGIDGFSIHRHDCLGLHAFFRDAAIPESPLHALTPLSPGLSPAQAIPCPASKTARALPRGFSFLAHPDCTADSAYWSKS